VLPAIPSTSVIINENYFWKLMIISVVGVASHFLCQYLAVHHDIAGSASPMSTVDDHIQHKVPSRLPPLPDHDFYIQYFTDFFVVTDWLAPSNSHQWLIITHLCNTPSLSTALGTTSLYLHSLVLIATIATYIPTARCVGRGTNKHSTLRLQDSQRLHVANMGNI
jgi:hypothetical protein